MLKSKMKNYRRQNKNYKNLPYYPIVNNNGLNYTKDNSF